jgi:hypothetical protein
VAALVGWGEVGDASSADNGDDDDSDTDDVGALAAGRKAAWALVVDVGWRRGATARRRRRADTKWSSSMPPVALNEPLKDPSAAHSKAC